jgi:hypothetical protein
MKMSRLPLNFFKFTFLGGYGEWVLVCLCTETGDWNAALAFDGFQSVHCESILIEVSVRLAVVKFSRVQQMP